MAELTPRNLDDYPLPKSDPGGPLMPGEHWYFWVSVSGEHKGRIRMKKVDGKSVRVHPWKTPSTEEHKAFLATLKKT